MKEYAEFTTISNSVDTHRFPEDQDVHMRQQTFKVCLRMLMS